MISLKSIQMTNKKGDSQSSSSNDKPAEAKNRGWPKGKRRYPKVNIIKSFTSAIQHLQFIVQLIF